MIITEQCSCGSRVSGSITGETPKEIQALNKWIEDWKLLHLDHYLKEINKK